MQEVLEVVEAILARPNDELTQQWNEFQNSDAAWSTLLDVIQSPSASQPVRLFACTTFRHKCTDGSLLALQPEALHELYQRLVACIGMDAIGKAEARSLCIAVGAVLAREPQLLEAALEGQGVFNDLPTNLAFDALASVPEMIQPSSFTTQQEHQRRIHASVNRVLSLTTQALEQGLSTTDGVAVCRTITAWCSGDVAASVTPQTTATLLPCLWPVLLADTPEAVVAAADAFTALLENVRISEHEECVQFLAARVCDAAEPAAQHVQALYASAYEHGIGGDDGDSAYTALLRFAAVWATSMALVLPRLLVQGNTDTVGAAVMTLCALLNHPLLPVAEVALVGFASLPELDGSADATVPLMREILNSICDRCCFIEDDGTRREWEEVAQDFNRVRRAARDAIADIALSLHDPIWPLAEELMSTRLSSDSPQRVEVALFLIEAVCSTVPAPQQSVSSQLGDTLAQVASLCFLQLAPDTRVELARLRLLNALIPHVVSNPNLIQPAFALCIERAQLPELAQEAGRVMAAVMAKLRRNLTGVDISSLASALVSAAVHTDAEEVIEAATRLLVAHVTSTGAYADALSSLTSGLLDRLSTILTAPDLNVIALCTSLDLLGIHVRFCDAMRTSEETHPVAVVLEQLSSQADQIVAFVPRGDDYPVPGEALCRLTMKAIKANPLVCVMQGAAVFHIVTESMKHHTKASMDVLCALVEVSSMLPDEQQQQLHSLIKNTIAIFSEQFPEDPAVACALLNLCFRSLVFQPTLVLSTRDESATFFQFALRALQADDVNTMCIAVQIFMFTLRQLNTLEQVREWLQHSGMQLVETVLDQVVARHDADLCRRLGAILAALVAIEADVVQSLPTVLAQALERQGMGARLQEAEEPLAPLLDPAKAGAVTADDVTQALLAIAAICNRR
ncbi:hypothetical protein PTSG_01718 [Salpingoeca rosetta]|uniref:Exportin-1/Importin-beta-like domain-containing protein n=1 Tax=Salpingoeca rosetta (strain ATCC 50818 / BSB-021) TaxID=946362 RepID=F2TYR5_SALR5|nr:uncharacterized protein PTSG_01718 [Salpingoeca rosetta]EGD78739.1 hypothetical protein PTSG_01718 [Salpingoeca rosetta]|eukprot:XP_004997696.1 hypothetical protein PTSG_01718 [Salpingoeca rosetta]